MSVAEAEVLARGLARVLADVPTDEARRIGGVDWIRQMPGMAARLGQD